MTVTRPGWMERASDGGKDDRNRVDAMDRYRDNHMRIYGPSRFDLDEACNDMSREKWKAIWSTCGVSKMMKNAKEEHRIVAMQYLKYANDMLSQGKRGTLPDWMVEGIIKSDVMEEQELGSLIGMTRFKLLMEE